MNRIGLLLACLAIIPVHAGELFRWVDAHGKVHYGDTPPADTLEVESKKFSNETSQNEDLPYETRRAQQNFPVTLYVGDACGGPCDHARDLLYKRGVPFKEELLKTQEDIDSFQKLSGGRNIPALQVGKSFLVGFLESSWNSELDVAGYPKTASYRQRVARPKPAATETPPSDGQPAEGASPKGQAAPTEPAAQ
jgi:hypothetical protein